MNLKPSASIATGIRRHGSLLTGKYQANRLMVINPAFLICSLFSLFSAC
jgi:hypothetical protein